MSQKGGATPTPRPPSVSGPERSRELGIWSWSISWNKSDVGIDFLEIKERNGLNLPKDSPNLFKFEPT